MNVLGIGGWEIGIIAVVALLIFGPGKLPEVMGQAGKLVRDFRRMSAELTGEFEKTIAEAKDIGSSIQAEVGGMSSQVNSVTNSVKKDLGIKGSGSTTKARSGITSKSAAASASAKKNASTATTTSKAGGKSASTASKAASTSTASETGAKTTTTSSAASTASTATATRKPVVPAASRDDPAAGISLFEPVAVERPRRSRTATPAVILDRTPRGGIHDVAEDAQGAVTSTTTGDRSVDAADDPFARARKRRRTAGYARQSA